MNAATTHEAMQLVEAAPTEARPPALQQGGALAASSPAAVMLSLMQGGASFEQMTQMMDLQERWEKREAEKAYNAAFAAFKAEAVSIIKNREVKDGPLRGKAYAELHAVVDAITPALSRNGLSASWRLTQDARDWIEVTCTLKHVAGHSESVSMGGPPDAGGAKNAIQARASTVSYLERYTLKAICGVAESGQDDDGNAHGGSAKLTWAQQAEAARTVDELSRIVKDGSAALQKAKDRDGYRALREAVQKRGAELTRAA